MNKKSSTDTKIRIGVIPAAGAGRRLGYLSTLLPKTLFPLYDRPIIHYVVNEMQNLGIEDIYIIVNVYKEKIIEYFEQIKMDLRCRVHFIEQNKLGGTADAMLLAKEYTKGDPFMVIYGDDCTITQSLPAMMKQFYKVKPVVMEMVVEETSFFRLRQTCSVKLGRDGRIEEIIEKPEDPPYQVRGCGVYLFSSEIYEHIEQTPVHPIRHEKEITYTINNLAKIGKAYGYQIEGHNININDYNELLTASNLLYKAKHE